MNSYFNISLTEVFPCFFRSCKASARVKLAKTDHGQHSSKLVVICCSVVVCVVLCIVCICVVLCIVFICVVLCIVFICVVLCIVCMSTCTVLLPPKCS